MIKKNLKADPEKYRNQVDLQEILAKSKDLVVDAQNNI
jgi:hypothetical protein